MTSLDSSPIKICTKCGDPFPATTKFFHKKKRGLYGLASWCKSCHSKITSPKAKKWYLDNTEKAKARMRADYAEHKTEILQRQADAYRKRKVREALENLYATYEQGVRERGKQGLGSEIEV